MVTEAKRYGGKEMTVKRANNEYAYENSRQNLNWTWFILSMNSRDEPNRSTYLVGTTIIYSIDIHKSTKQLTESMAEQNPNMNIDELMSAGLNQGSRAGEPAGV